VAYAYDYTPDEEDSLCFSSSWALIMDRHTVELRPALQANARLLRQVRPFRTWTDDFSNMLAILR